jgi:hypothetical protein
MKKITMKLAGYERVSYEIIRVMKISSYEMNVSHSVKLGIKMNLCMNNADRLNKINSRGIIC